MGGARAYVPLATGAYHRNLPSEHCSASASGMASIRPMILPQQLSRRAITSSGHSRFYLLAAKYERRRLSRAGAVRKLSLAIDRGLSMSHRAAGHFFAIPVLLPATTACVVPYDDNLQPAISAGSAASYPPLGLWTDISPRSNVIWV